MRLYLYVGASENVMSSGPRANKNPDGSLYCCRLSGFLVTGLLDGHSEFVCYFNCQMRQSLAPRVRVIKHFPDAL